MAQQYPLLLQFNELDTLWVSFRSAQGTMDPPVVTVARAQGISDPRGSIFLQLKQPRTPRDRSCLSANNRGPPDVGFA